MNQLPRSITSLEVAEMVGRRHDNVMSEIRTIISHLGDDLKIKGIYFTESEYVDKLNRKKPCFLLTKKGCELYGTRMTGEKGTQFAVKYIERFNEMEQHIQQQLPSDPITLALEAALETRKTVQTIQSEVKEVKADIEDLRDNLVITTLQAKSLRKKVGEKVYEALGGKESNAFKHMRAKLFAECWNDFKNYFGLSEYRELPRVKYEQGMKFLLAWAPNTESRLEIEHYNTQIELKLVK